MWDRVEVAGYVAFYHPLVGLTLSGQPIGNVCYGVIGASIWPESVGMLTKVCFPYRFEDHAQGFLYNAVTDTGNAYSTLHLYPNLFWNL